LTVLIAGESVFLVAISPPSSSINKVDHWKKLDR
jgi:hypothetical protein